MENPPSKTFTFYPADATPSTVGGTYVDNINENEYTVIFKELKTYTVSAKVNNLASNANIVIHPKLVSISPKAGFEKVGVNTSLGKEDFNVVTNPAGHGNEVDFSAIDTSNEGKLTVTASLAPDQTADCSVVITSDWITLTNGEPDVEKSKRVAGTPYKGTDVRWYVNLMDVWTEDI